MEFPLANTFGIRDSLYLQSANDFHRHRHRLNKKLKHLRHALNIQTKDTKNYVSKEKISSIDSESFEQDTRFGEVLLFNIERDLLYAEETRLSSEVNSSKGKERFIISKYKKALSNAKKLLKVIDSQNTSDSLLEVYVYTAIIEGSLNIFRKNWKLSINAFSVARCGLQYLYSKRELPTEFTKELYIELIDTIVDPGLKISSLRISNDRSVPELLSFSRIHCHDESLPYLAPAIELISSKDPSFVTSSGDTSDGTEILKSIQWFEYEANLANEDLASKISSAILQSKDLSKNSAISLYDPSLASWQDALQIHTQDMARSKNEDSEEDSQEKYIISTYINYKYLLLRIRRDVKILSNIESKFISKKNISRASLLESYRDSIKVLDVIINSINEIKELSGVANIDDVISSFDSLSTFFHIQKIIALSKSYLLSSKYKEALALINKCSELSETELKPFEIEFEGNLPTNDTLPEFKENISNILRSTHVLTQFKKGSASSSSEKSDFEYIIDNMKSFPTASSDEVLKSIAPVNEDCQLVQPVHTKPVLFDIAFNYIGYDNTHDEVPGPAVPVVEETPLKAVSSDVTDSERSDSTEPEEKKRGFFGLFGRK
ncbi:hypothetical protein B5S31_g518 [[Candida] boidinii]|nr:hypothetical protein B5S31_g518 [[Candida] boidinii]